MAANMFVQAGSSACTGQPCGFDPQVRRIAVEFRLGMILRNLSNMHSRWSLSVTLLRQCRTIDYGMVFHKNQEIGSSIRRFVMLWIIQVVKPLAGNGRYRN